MANLLKNVTVENSNCLAGMCCPNCSSLGPFKLMTKGPDPDVADGMGQMELHRAVEAGDVQVTEYIAEWEDDGSIDTAGDTVFVEDGAAECTQCEHTGTVSSFRCVDID